MLVKIDKIISDPGQPRKTFKEGTLEELRESIDSLGLINPLTVRPTGDGRHMIIVGERRFRAAKMEGLSEVECIVRDDVDDRMAREMQFAENYHLERLPSVEQSKAWHEHINKYGLSMAEFARRIGISRSTVNDAISTVTELHPELQNELSTGTITFVEARGLADVRDSNKQLEIAKPIIEGKVGGRKVQPYIAKAKAEPTRPVEDIVDEVVYGIKHVPKEELELAKPPETMLDIGFKLEQKALDLSQMLATSDLSRIPGGQRQALIGALKILTDRIRLALESLTGQKLPKVKVIIEGEARQIEE